MYQSSNFQVKKFKKNSKIFIFFLKLVQIIQEVLWMVPGHVLGPKASQKGSGMVIQRFEKIFENRILRSKNRIFMIRNKIDRKKHDFRSDSKSIGSLSMDAQIKSSKESV